MSYHYEFKLTELTGKNTFRLLINYLLFIMILGMAISCSTKKNTFTRRLYHNLTSHYNAYWNGNESFRQGIAQLAKAHKDDYNKVLHVYQYGSETDAQAIYPQMDRAIEKATKVIQKHSIFIKRKEHIRWIDDSYLLMGKAYLYKKEYRQARRTFDFITKRFSKNPIKYDAMIWMARVNNIEGDYALSQSLLDEVQNQIRKGKADKSLEKELSMVYADYYIYREDYGPAIEYLQRAIQLNHRKDIVNRLSFILAQIYQKQGYLDQATKHYTRVIKKSPPYEMAFNAKINLAKCYDASTSDSKLILKKLNKMLKDQKNFEFLDQVYYALAEIAMKEKNQPKAIKNLRLSVSHSISNNYQKAASSLEVADILFKVPQYMLAKAYFDTAMQALPEDYPDYHEISEKTLILTELVDNILIVEREDSLQALAKMTDKERNAIIDKIIADIIKEEELRRQEEIDRQQSLNFLERTNRQSGQTGTSTSANWYFYNPTQISLGYSEFQKKWGKRKLEDNWRLSIKQLSNFDFGDDEEAETDSLLTDSMKTAKGNPKDRKFYLKDIPLTEEKLAKSNEKIAKALYNQGSIYLEGLDDPENALIAFEELIKRFPGNDYQLEAFYQLYKIYTNAGDLVMADKYKNLIITEYPNSDYAKIIIDPDYNEHLLAKKNEASLFYKETFLAFKSKKYSQVIINCDTAMSRYQDKTLIPKFEYLRSLSIGKIHNEDSLVNALQQLIQEYPESEVKSHAENILAYLGIGQENTVTAIKGKTDSLDKSTIDNSIYNLDSGAKHLYIILIDAKLVNTNALKVKISDFNKKYFGLIELNISNIIFDQQMQVITVSSFEDKKKGLDYYNTIKDNKYLFSNLEKSSYYQFIITTPNYASFYKDKKIEKYEAFFKKNYLN